MGRIFMDHIGGSRPIYCAKCETPLTNKEEQESSGYQGSSGKAYLYTRAVNLKYSPVDVRTMLTGQHYVRDVYCKGCDQKLGWMYEFAVPKDQRHKEGKVILEKHFIKEIR